MTSGSNVVIIGGGAAGCATAYYLAKAGIKAAIVERDGIGSQASGYSAGGLNPLQGAGLPGPLTPLAMESFRMHLEGSRQLIEESGVDFQPQMVAKVSVAFSQSQLPALQETLDIYQAARGFAAHWLDADYLYDIEPRLGPGILRGLYHYGDAALNSYKYTLALARASERMGAKVIPAEATGLVKSGARVTGVQTKNGRLTCGAVVIATGPWSGMAQEWLDGPVPVTPLKGQILRMELPGPRLIHEYSSAGVSLFTRRDGLIWVGATEEPRSFDDKPSEAARRTLMERATRLLPAVREARLVKHTACLRPVTADWLPIIGRAPGWDNVYLATGAGKKGILICPGIGKATADLIASGTTALPIAPFAPERFIRAGA